MYLNLLLSIVCSNCSFKVILISPYTLLPFSQKSRYTRWLQWLRDYNNLEVVIVQTHLTLSKGKVCLSWVQWQQDTCYQRNFMFIKWSEKPDIRITLYLSFGSNMKQITLHSYHLRVIILSSCTVIFLYPFWLWYLIIKFYVMFAHLSFADDTSISSTSVFSLVFDTTWSHYSIRGLNVYRY